MHAPTRHFVLRDLSLATRLTLAAFLVSVGVGYCSALVQLHFQHASPGKALPTPDDAVTTFYGRSGASQLERILVADEGKPFNGNGSMRQTFTAKSAGWKAAIKRRAKDKSIGPTEAEKQLRREREGELLAIVDWIRSGAHRETYENNNHTLSAHLTSHPITSDFVASDTVGPVQVKIASIFEARCGRCHAEGTSGKASQFPLDNWEQIRDYCEVETAAGGMSLKKLAQTTHVHLLGFAMLYCLTGLTLTLTSYPGWIKAPLGVWPLIAQVVDISFWWLGRMDPMYARFIVYTGSAVALGLMLQIGLSLFNMFGKFGKATLIVLILAGALGGWWVKSEIVEPFLIKEHASAALSE